jgi:putative ABC transport system ATP-binding protein
MTPNKILEAKDVKKVYDIGGTKINALDGVSLEIHQGDFLSIIGKSGSGKSTLLHLIGLLDTPTSGNIILREKNVSQLSERSLAKVRNEEVGFVFQSFNLLARATALDNVILPLKYSKKPKSEWKQRAEEMLKAVELGDRMNNKSNELSGGQKQRVAIARALVTDPTFILADEPTGNLDTKTGDEIAHLFEKLHHEGKTIVIVTHDRDLANIANKRVYLSDGKIIKSS